MAFWLQTMSTMWVICACVVLHVLEMILWMLLMLLMGALHRDDLLAAWHNNADLSEVVIDIAEIVVNFDAEVEVNVEDEDVVGVCSYKWSVMMLWWNKDVVDEPLLYDVGLLMMMLLVVRMVRVVHMGDTINWEKYFSADKIQHTSISEWWQPLKLF